MRTAPTPEPEYTKKVEETTRINIVVPFAKIKKMLEVEYPELVGSNFSFSANYEEDDIQVIRVNATKTVSKG